MSDFETWHQRQLDRAESLLDEGRRSIERGQLSAGAEVVDEALVILDMAKAERFDDDVRRIRARGLNDRGLLHQQEEQFDRARTVHRRAADLLDDVEVLEGDTIASAAAVHLNLGQLSLFDEEFETARKATERTLEFVERMRTESVEGAETLALSAQQNRSAVESLTGHFDEAIAAAERALELAEHLADRERPDALGQAARIAQQLSVQLFDGDRIEDALEWGQRAESLSERAHDHVGEEALHLYVVSQINLISFYEEQRRFADAEDCLWKAIEVAGPDPDLLDRGKAFYEQCRKFTDDILEAGDLPRDEVEMGREDLQELIDEAELRGGQSAQPH